LIPDVFLDSNVLIYAATGRFAAPAKYEIGQTLIAGNFGVSGQVLAEFYTNVIKKGRIPLTKEEALLWVRALSRKPLVVVDAALVQAGIERSMRYQISYWDGAIIAAAERLGVRTVLSEDLSHGQTYGTVTVLNPFREVSDPPP
jgi:predicted nucleic acid-binding protein